MHSPSLVVGLNIIIEKLKVALNERTENLPLSPGSEVPEMVGEYTYFGLIPSANRNHEKQIRRRISVVYRLHSAGTKRNFNN